MDLASAFATHRRRAVEALKNSEKEVAREHLVHAAALVAPLRGVECSLALRKTAESMATTLSVLSSEDSSSADGLRGLGRGPQRRMDGSKAYTFDEFVEFYGRDAALEIFEARPKANDSLHYSKLHMRSIRRHIK